MEKVFEMVFAYANGKRKTLTIRAPKEDISDEQAREAMQAIIDADVFVSDAHGSLAEIVEARYKTTTVETVVADQAV